MQLLAITAMEPPAKFDKNGFRNEVIKVYQSLRPLTDKYIRDNVIRGQYIAGDDRIGYREERMFVLFPYRYLRGDVSVCG